MVGAAIGGSTGLYNGLRRSVLAGESGKLRRTQVKIQTKNASSYFFVLCNPEYTLAPLLLLNLQLIFYALISNTTKAK